jgi:hypothetical protein
MNFRSRNEGRFTHSAEIVVCALFRRSLPFQWRGRICYCIHCLKIDLQVLAYTTRGNAIWCPPRKLPTTNDRNEDSILYVQSTCVNTCMMKISKGDSLGDSHSQSLRDTPQNVGNLAFRGTTSKIEQDSTIVWRASLSGKIGNYRDPNFPR